MKIVKWLLAGIGLMAAVFLLGGLALSSKFSVSRSIVVQAPADRVYALVDDPRAWAQWSAWNRRDPAMRVDYSGAPRGAGAVWAWHSPSQGDGRMTFTTAEPNRLLGYELFFPDFGTTSTGALRFTPEGGATRVVWTMDGDMGANPLYHWFALFADRMVGKDFDDGLAHLKIAAERPR